MLALSHPAFAAVTWNDLNLPANLFPASSEYHTVEAVREDPQVPGALIFTVTSAGKTTQVEGLVALKKWIHEAAVIAELKKKGTTSGVAEGAAESIKSTGRGLKNFVLHPVKSVKGIGTAAGEIGDKVGGAFDKKEEGETGDTFLSSTKRQIAKKLGVDVYSRNPELQAELDALAKRQMGGRGAVFVVSFLLPVGLLASAVMTVSNVNSAADELVNDKDRGDLYQLNKDALLALGFPLEKIRDFLNHPYYTPREVTYIRFYLQKFGTLPGSKNLLDEAVKRVAEVPAQRFLHEMQMAADAAATLRDAVAVRVVPEGLVIERRESVLLITDYDYLNASPLGDQVIKRAQASKQEAGKGGAAIWNGGIVTSKFSGQLIFKGMQLRRMCLFNLGTSVTEPGDV